MLDYGIIGNCNTCALVKKNASIDWMCFPAFSSPSLFCKILDSKKGGSFEIITKEKYEITQNYVEETNILETLFISPERSFKVIDFFPRYKKLLPSRKIKMFKQNMLIRIIKPIKGKNIIKIIYNPKLNYARGVTKLKQTRTGLLAKDNKIRIYLNSNLEYKKICNKEFFELDNTKYFVVRDRENKLSFNLTRCLNILNATKKYWQNWVSTLVLPEKNRELIIRSALTLKLLTYSETGAIVAAATTSIPEQVKTVRNWDYRYCWVRDAVFTVDALKKIGRDYESKRLMEFIIENSMKKKEPVHILYGIHGETKIPEIKLNHLAGFKNSKPVRVGNEAYNQTQMQLDIFGEIIDIMYLYYAYYSYETKMNKKYWKFLKYLVTQIKQNWKREDSGIWEFRGIQNHYTYSKLMCFVGIDRAIRLAQHYNKEEFMNKWIPLRDEIMEDILKNAWNPKRRAFTMYYGGYELDASASLFTYHEFLDSNDPRIIFTIKKIYNELRTGELVQRYKMKDDFGISKSAFIICSFWLVDALYNIGDVGKATRMFNKLIRISNHLGLFSEVADVKSKKLVGNFPQAYSHIALINSSILLSEWSAKRKKIDWDVLPRRKKWF